MNRLPLDQKSFLQVVKEFLKALTQKRTYNIFKNWYCFFGILWGIPIPVVTISIDLYSSGLAFTAAGISHIVGSHPFHFFFLLHPMLFGVVFGAMGTVRYNKQQKIEESEENLINKNKELESANKKLQQLDKLKSNFLSIVSHELRTPLTTIQGYITFLRSEKSGNLNVEQKECLKISEETADQLNYLIEELLDLSKIEAGEFKVKLTSVDMREIVEKAVLSLKLFADEQGVLLKNHLAQNLPNALADSERILQVVVNLLKNSIKFNKRGGEANITASYAGQNNRIVFSISDTGIGISKDHIDKIFDKFYQVDTSGKRKYGGCGLGLAITKSIVELHRGRIWVESKLNEGSKFFFELLTCGRE